MSHFTLKYDDSAGWLAQTAMSPKELEKDPRLFDELSRVMDHVKFFDGEPLDSGIMMPFTIICGEITGKYYWGVFRAEGLSRKFRKGKTPEYFLRGRMIDGWYEVDNTLPIEVPKEPVKDKEAA